MVATSDCPAEASLFTKGFCGGILPLPSTPVSCAPPSHLSRGTRQRVARRNYVEREFQSLTDAVNWIGGCSSVSAPALAAPAHHSFQERAYTLVGERCEEEKSFFAESTYEAVRMLLRAHSGYQDEPEAGVGGLATFKQGNVSLPTSSANSPLLRSLVSDKASTHLDDISSMLNNSDDIAAAGLSVPQLYMDPVLGRRGDAYNEFIKDLSRRGMIRFSRRPKGHVTVFF